MQGEVGWKQVQAGAREVSLEGGDLGELGFLGGRDWARRERGPEGREPQGASGSGEGTSLTAGLRIVVLGTRQERQVWAQAGKVLVHA